MNDLQKRISMLEGDLDQAQTQLEEATGKLETVEKDLAKVSSAARCDYPSDAWTP